jgi:hypothetical protein
MPGLIRRVAGPTWLLIAIILAGGALRLLTLGVQSYWYNEAATVFLVRHSLGSMLHLIPNMEGNPPLYYILAWGWSRLFGIGEVGLRSFSALAGTALIPVTYAIAKHMAGVRVGIVVAALTAVNPLLFWFSQEARPYILLALFVAVGFLFFLRALEEDSWRPMVLWAVMSIIALATHYFALWVVVPEFLWLLLRARNRRAVVAIGVVLAGAGGALLPLALKQRTDQVATSIVGSFGQRIVELPKQLLLGYSGPLEKPLTAAVAVISAYGVYLALTRTAPHRHRSAVLLVCVAGAALLMVLAAAAVGLDYITTRNLIELCLFAVLVVGIGLGAPEAGARGTLACVCLCALLLADIVGVELNPVYQRDDWRGAVRALGPASSLRALVVTPGQGYYPLLYYLPHARLMAQPATVSELDLLGIAIRPGSGVPPAPPSPPPQPPIPGFQQVALYRDRMFTVARYRAVKGTLLSAAALKGKALSPGSALVFLDESRTTR